MQLVSGQKYNWHTQIKLSCLCVEDLTSDPTLYITIITKPAAYGTAGGHFVNCHKAVSWWRVALLTFNNNVWTYNNKGEPLMYATPN